MEHINCSSAHSAPGDVDDDDDLVYLENRVELMQLASDAVNENPKLDRLQRTLLDQFQNKDSRGIIFAKTREITRCLYDWVRTNPELRRAKIRSANLVGAGTGATHMTQVGSRWRTCLVGCWIHPCFGSVSTTGTRASSFLIHRKWFSVNHQLFE